MGNLKMDADEAVSKSGTLGTKKEKLLEEIESKQDERFRDIRSLRFGWVKQPIEGSKETETKLMSMLPNGKVVFVDRSQDVTDINIEDPYICMVYEREREAFAKILFPEYQPKIYIPPSRIPAMVWRDESGKTHRKLPHGNTYEERLIQALKEMEKLGFESIKVVFRKNIRS